MAGWGQGSSEQQLRSRLASQRAAESLLGLDKVLCWHGYAASRLEVIHVKPTFSCHCCRCTFWEQPAPVAPRKSEVFSQCKRSESLKKKNLATPPVPVLKTLPAFHEMNRRKNFLSTSCLFFIYSFPPPKWDLCLSAVAAQLPLAKWNPQKQKTRPKIFKWLLITDGLRLSNFCWKMREATDFMCSWRYLKPKRM